MSNHTPAVEQSYRYCRQVVRRSGSNFSLAFLLLPPPQRRAMYALYAFAREADDLADGPKPLDERRGAIERFQETFEAAVSGRPSGPLMPAVVDTIHRYCVPTRHFREITAGVQMDLDHRGFETFDELRDYCHHVASAVGLACLPIWNAASDDAHQSAVDCGIAFQLTNILRDVHEDAQLGRLYLPREDLRRFGCDAEDLFDRAHVDRVRQLLAFEADRAAAYYQSAATLETHLSGSPRRVFALMYGRYAGLLRKIRRDYTAVLSRKLKLSLAEKLTVAGRAIAGQPLAAPR